MGEIIPEPPRNCKEEYRLNPEQIDVLKKRNPLTLEPFNETKKNITDSKGKMQVPNKLAIKKPYLINSMRFASEEGSFIEEIAADTNQVVNAK